MGATGVLLPRYLSLKAYRIENKISLMLIHGLLDKKLGKAKLDCPIDADVGKKNDLNTPTKLALLLLCLKL